MRNYLSLSILFLLLIQLNNIHAKSRTKSYAIKGKITLKKPKPFKHKSAYWKFMDPFASTKIQEYEEFNDLVVLIFKEIGGKEKSPKLKVIGASFEPKTKILNYTQDLEIENQMNEDITVYSPGRIKDRKDLPPQLVASGGSVVYTVGPSDEEAEDHSKLFWAFPLRLKGYPFAKGWVIFVRSTYYSNVKPDGTFTLPPLEPGKYEIRFIYKGKLISKKIPVTIPKKHRKKYIKIEIKDLSLEEK